MNIPIRPGVHQTLVETAKAKGLETGAERLAAMRPQCGFGELGTCCRICYMGPCRIDPFGNGPKTGICGASPDTMVARNLLRETIGGASSHVGHARHLLLTLRDALSGEAPYEIRGEAKAFAVAKQFGVPTEGRTAKEVCLDLVDIALQDFGRQDGKLNNWLSKRAPAKELEMWQKLGIAYSNPHNEIETAMHATSMGNDADPITLLLRTLKLGLVDGWTGLALCTDVQDILFGTPQVTVVESSAGVLRENSVNIATHGHNPVLSEKILEWARKLEGEAIAAGAESMNVVGVCCTGNELGMRHGVPLAAHNAQSELILATGAVDAMVVDIQCIWPSLPQLAACFDTSFITTDEMVHIPGATHIEFEPTHADESAQKVVRMAIASFVKAPRQEGRYSEPHVQGIRGPLGRGHRWHSLEGRCGRSAEAGDRQRRQWQHSGLCRHRRLLQREVPRRRDDREAGQGAAGKQRAGGDDRMHGSHLRPGRPPHFRGDREILRRRAQGGADRGWACGGAGCSRCRRFGTWVPASTIPALSICWRPWPVGLASRSASFRPSARRRSWFRKRRSPSASPSWRSARPCMSLRLRAFLGGPAVTQVLTQDLAGITGAKVIVEYDPIKAAAAMVAHIKEKRAALGLS